MDDLDKRLLNRIQSDFPLVARPFEELGRSLGLSEDEVVERMRALKAGRIVRQVSAIFDTKSLGYKSSLVAMRVDPTRIAEAARIINEHPGVTHNYERIHQLAGAEVTRVMYTLRLFKIGVNLDMTGERPPDAIAAPEYREQDRIRARDFTVTEQDQAVIRELQEDLPIEARPFKRWPSGSGWTRTGCSR